ncbi:hypothetical protein PRZ48_002648 [Zasmidium cellare]|uniref:C3H1-type domain-containing protein n=1 Tax=Zasmidium cellare TaxID=395010 RepID=A0ABR0ET18_ZASCE|nr:hypothetical protein PRZ48_002648 [Zasmidium cellare]
MASEHGSFDELADEILNTNKEFFEDRRTREERLEVENKRLKETNTQLKEDNEQLRARLELSPSYTNWVPVAALLLNQPRALDPRVRAQRPSEWACVVRGLKEEVEKRDSDIRHLKALLAGRPSLRVTSELLAAHGIHDIAMPSAPQVQMPPFTVLTDNTGLDESTPEETRSQVSALRNTYSASAADGQDWGARLTTIADLPKKSDLFEDILPPQDPRRPYAVIIDSAISRNSQPTSVTTTSNNASGINTLSNGTPSTHILNDHGFNESHRRPLKRPRSEPPSSSTHYPARSNHHRVPSLQASSNPAQSARRAVCVCCWKGGDFCTSEASCKPCGAKNKDCVYLLCVQGKDCQRNNCPYVHPGQQVVGNEMRNVQEGCLGPAGRRKKEAVDDAKGLRRRK